MKFLKRETLGTEQSSVTLGRHQIINSLVHQPFEKLGEVPCETSVKKCVTGDVSHIIFWQ